MKILRWKSVIRTPVRYHSVPTRPWEGSDSYELEILPLVEPDGKVHFEQHKLSRNGTTLYIEIYPYNPDSSDVRLMSLGMARLIDLN